MTLCDSFKIDGNPIVVPDRDVTVTRNDVESSDTGTDESGVMRRFLLRSGVKKWAFQYTNMTEEEYRYMESIISGKASFIFAFTDADGKEETCTAYCHGTSVAIRNIRTGLYSSYAFEINQC